MHDGEELQTRRTRDISTQQRSALHTLPTVALIGQAQETHTPEVCRSTEAESHKPPLPI